MGIPVPRRREDGRVACLGERHEVVRPGSGPHGVDGDVQTAVGPVLEPDRAGQSRRQLSVALALGGPGADRAPADEIGHVLRAYQVEEFGAGRQAHFIDV